MNVNQKDPLPFNEHTANALVDALGAVVMCMANQLTPEQRDGLASELAGLSVKVGSEGNLTLSVLLADLQRLAT